MPLIEDNYGKRSDPPRDIGRNLRWYVIHTQPHAEARAAARLQAQGYVICAPKLWRMVRHARRSQLSATPLFPRYIFVQLDLDRHQWRSINGTYGVTSLVSVNDRPLTLPHGVVESIMAAHQTNTPAALAPTLKLNDPVRLSAGPFVDLIGSIQKIDAKGRVQILFELMGRAVCVSAATSDCHRALN